MSEALRHLENGEPDLSPSTGVDDISSRWRLMHRAGESSFSYRHPVVSQVVVLSDAMCVCLAVVACIAWQRIYDTPELSGALLLANVMAGGAFFLFPKMCPCSTFPISPGFLSSSVISPPPVVFGLVVFCVILVMLSWPVGVAVRMGGEWLVFVVVALAAERIIGYLYTANGGDGPSPDAQGGDYRFRRGSNPDGRTHQHPHAAHVPPCWHI